MRTAFGLRPMFDRPGPHRAGGHARRTSRQYALRGLVGLVSFVGAALIAGLGFGWRSPVTLAVELVAICAMLAGDRLLTPRIDRWHRGAVGEEKVGAILDGLADRGWLALHDVQRAQGNIDHVLIGPGGMFTVETKSHPGRRRVAHIDPSWLKQAYAQSKALQRITGQPVQLLLVFSRAYLDDPGRCRQGVVVLPARMLAGHLSRRKAKLSDDQVQALYQRLRAAFT